MHVFVLRTVSIAVPLVTESISFEYQTAAQIVRNLGNHHGNLKSTNIEQE